MMNFSPDNNPKNTQEQSFHPADIAAETKILLDTYQLLLRDTINDITKLHQQQKHSQSVLNPEIMNNPGDYIDNPELSTEDFEKKIINLKKQGDIMFSRVKQLLIEYTNLKKQASIDPSLN